MTSLLLFDLDGTVVDTAYDLIETANKVFSNNNNYSIVEIKEKNLPHTHINKNFLKSIA